jgi:maleamate amidohydrolase
VPLVVGNAVGDRDPRPYEANLFDLTAKYAEVVDEAWAVDYLSGCGLGGHRSGRDEA